MRRLSLVSVVSMALVALAWTAAFAQTPDGETPAVEAVCDPLQVGNGGTPGLYGLCVAYCEAQDCHSPEVLAACQAANSGDPWAVHACGCNDVLENYNNKRLESDPTMPCVLPAACPCFDAEFVATELSAPTACVDRDAETRKQTLINGADAQQCRAVAQTFALFDENGNTRAVVCQAVDTDRNPDTNACDVTLNTVQSDISLEEFGACQALLQAYIEEQSLSCSS